MSAVQAAAATGGPLPPLDGGRAAPTASSSAAAAAPAFVPTARNTATQRKVAKLLDITTSSEIKDLASYVDDILPGYFYGLDPVVEDGSATTTTTAQQQQQPATPGSGGTGATTITSAALRSALDRRAIDVHKNFLREFGAVYESFQRTAAQVGELQAKCSSLEETLSNSAGRPSRDVDDFFYRIQAYQAELQLVQSHDQEVESFRKQHQFGAAEQQALEEGPVDMAFLNVLERARQVHQRSSELMQSQEYHQGAAAVMEATYAAIARATEKIARHLLATAGNATGSGELGAGGGVAASAAAGGVGSIAADVPEVTGFQLRCVRLLYEESSSLHEKFLDEVARLRRASVLRRYFHLLTTGSANTSTGLYQSGGQPTASTRGDGEAGMGARPLEAELNNPTYFFSSLCAWLHQTIVEEQDFLHNFFVSDDVGSGHAGRRAHAGGAAIEAGLDTARTAHDAARQQALLDSVFGGVCKHIRAALDNVLERVGRTAAVLGAAGSGATAAGDGGSGGGAAEAGGGGGGAFAPRKGPRGLTGGLTRLFMAATGRMPAGHSRSGATSDEANAVLQRYAAVTTRAQQEAVAGSMLHPPLQGIQTCVTLVQLFEYYTATTFTPLLGADAALTRLVRETAPEQTRELFHRLLRVLAVHLLDSTAGVTSRTAALRRLASSNALKQAASAEDAHQADSSINTSASSAGSTGKAASCSSTFVLDFLVTLTYGEDAGSAGVGNASQGTLLYDGDGDAAVSASALSVTTARFRQANDGQVQRQSAHDLKRVLTQLILPPSPEVVAYCDVLHSVLQETGRQVELLHAIADQQQQQQQQQQEGAQASGKATAAHTEVRAFVREMLQSLLATAHSTEASDSALRANLDEPCRCIVQYNVLWQLRDVLERHASVLEQLFSSETDGAGPAPRHALEAIRAETVAAMAALQQRLMSAWASAVQAFYFPVSADSVVQAAAAAAEADEQHHITLKKDLRRVLKQLVNVYNTVASLGRLPEPVPLLQALAGADDISAEVSRCVTSRVVTAAYPAEFAALQRLPPTEELTAVQTEMPPENLTALVDFGSAAA